MTMLRLAQDDMRFAIRVGAVCLCDGHVLLAGTEADGFWILPGGHGELLERTDDTVRRELREELEVEVQVGRLLWVVENFFIYEGVRSHSICFIYEAHLPAGCDLLDTTRDFEGMDEGVAFIGRWFPLASLADTRLVPSFLREALSSLPETPQHLAHVDREER